MGKENYPLEDYKIENMTSQKLMGTYKNDRQNLFKDYEKDGVEGVKNKVNFINELTEIQKNLKIQDVSTIEEVPTNNNVSKSINSTPNSKPPSKNEGMNLN